MKANTVSVKMFRRSQTRRLQRERFSFEIVREFRFRCLYHVIYITESWKMFLRLQCINSVLKVRSNKNGWKKYSGRCSSEIGVTLKFSQEVFWPLCVEGKAQYSCLKRTSRETFHCAKNDHSSKTQVPYLHLCLKTKAIIRALKKMKKAVSLSLSF